MMVMKRVFADVDLEFLNEYCGMVINLVMVDALLTSTYYAIHFSVLNCMPFYA